jgi:Na+/H+ antiporter NhaC
MGQDYDISPKRAACLLDTFSCVFQGVIPYGAQMLVAISATAEMGVQLSAFQIMQYLFYPYLLLISVTVSIFLLRKRK